MTSTTEPPDLATTYLRLRPDVSVQALPVDADFWPRIARGELGDFHNEFLVTLHTHGAPWPMWEMHPNGDEVVCLVSGAVDFDLEEQDGTRRVALRSPGQFVLVPRGCWHTATPLQQCCLLFITAGEGTLHRAATPQDRQSPESRADSPAKGKS